METGIESYALITGGSSGIGKAIAMELASRGYHIAIVALPNTGQSEAIPEIKNKHQVNVESLELNILDNGAVDKITSWISEKGLTVSILVNNAGVGYADPFTSLSREFISTLIGLNVQATTLITHALLPLLVKNEKSFILNISSAAAFYSMPYKSIYAASKRFVLDFSTSLREEVLDRNVSVTAVCPAGVITSQEIRERISQAGYVAKKSALEPEQVAKEAVKSLFSKKAKIVPGKIARLMAFMRFVVPSSVQRRIIAKNFKKESA